MLDSNKVKDSQQEKTSGTVLVLGGTGATGKYVVRYLLERSFTVKVVVRSKEKMLHLLSSMENFDFQEEKLILKESNILDMEADELLAFIKECRSVICCLGHNLTFSGIFGKPRRLVTDSIKRICESVRKLYPEETVKFVLMGTVGVAHPKGTDDKRSCGERCLLRFLHYTLPPHCDNEDAAEYLQKEIGTDSSNKYPDWCVVRPDDLLDGEMTQYEILTKPKESLFGGEGHTIRANVAHFMVSLITDEDLWSKWKFDFPVINDVAALDNTVGNS